MNRGMVASRPASWLLVAWATFVPGACTQYSDDPASSLSVPTRETFAPLGAVLEPHCGTLDCHGSPARNFRVYGVYGLRANGGDVTGGADTTEADVDATYASIVGVDPEPLSAVLHDHGRDPERWLVVMKAEGLDHHTGGTPLPTGTPANRCLISWIGGALDEQSCDSDVFGPVPRDGETW